MIYNDKMYMIRNSNTGKFSTGGMRPKWKENGKVWRGIGPLKNHLNLVRYSPDHHLVEVQLVVGNEFSMEDLQIYLHRERIHKAASQSATRAASEAAAEIRSAKATAEKYGFKLVQEQEGACVKTSK